MGPAYLAEMKANIQDPTYGMFANSPNYDLVDQISTQAASASGTSNVTQPNRKFDNSRYLYAGRSYGVDSSVGLADEVFVQNTTQRYGSNEYGYLTQVQSIRNNTSDWAIHETEYEFEGGLPNLYAVAGTLANGQSEEHVACNLGSPDNIVALLGSHKQDTKVFAIAAGKDDTALDKIQCTVDFIPAAFSVSVNQSRTHDHY